MLGGGGRKQGVIRGFWSEDVVVLGRNKIYWDTGTVFQPLEKKLGKHE